MTHTYMLVKDCHGIEHLVAKDRRSLCGHLLAPASYYGYSLGFAPPPPTRPWDDDEDCPRCEVQLKRFHP